MDPNAALLEIRQLSNELIADGCHDPNGTEDLIQYVRDLDDWLTRGGFLPDAWRPVTGVEAIKSRGGF